MLSGFNTNVRHKGVVFHVQTEDSGRDHPHVITHLFHGGNILASEKQSYQQLLQEDDLESAVKRLMDELHGAMLDKLRSGALDRVIRERLGTASGRSAPAAASAAPPPGPAPSAPAPPPARAAAQRPTPAEPTAEPQRPLDEVVLDYLLESARQRSRR